MKGKNVIGEAGSGIGSSERNGKNKECEIDRISNLPDSVLAHILSFLPTREAVKTLLLRRFGFLWATSDYLDLDACSFHDCEEPESDDGPRYKRFINFVAHALTFHERNPIHCFRLNVEFFMRYSVDKDYLGDPGGQKLIKREMRLANNINTWTRFAIRRDVKVLDLDFLACGHSDDPETLYKIPDFVFNCDSIRELKLVCCKIEPQGKILMRSLRTLFLKHVALKENKIYEILSGFPLLEKLSLIECYNLCKLNLVSPNLKYLKVVVGSFDNSRMEISGPNIISLDISGSAGQVDLKNLSSLKDAALGFKYSSLRSEYKNHEAVRNILQNLNRAKVLTIYEQSIQLWTAWEILKEISFPSMPEKHLILNTDLSKEHLPGIVSLLRSSPSLEIFDIHIKNTFLTATCFSRRPLESYWSKLEESFQDLTNNLRTVRIYSLVPEACVLQLVQFLLKNLTGLEKMVIASKRSDGSNEKSCFTSDELLELSQKLLSFPRASASAGIFFS